MSFSARLLVLACALGVGCGTSVPPPDGSGGEQNGDGSGGTESGGSQNGESGGSENGESGGDGSGAALGTGGGLDPLPPNEECPAHCSNDLKDVLDCEGEVLEQCSGGDACLEGTCVSDACAAAAASQSSVGCEYWAIKPDLAVEPAQAGCFAVVVANTWTTALTLEVTYEGEPLSERPFIYSPRGQGLELTYEPYDPAEGLAAGDVAILFLADSYAPGSLFPGCPEAPYLSEEVGVLGTGRGVGFQVRTTAPVAAYSIVPYGGGVGATTSASLLLPTSRWDREYIAVNAYAAAEVVGVPSLDILASEDGTVVDILPKVDVEGGTDVDPALAAEPVTYELDRGEYLQISQTAELTGSPIIANKPIAVWGGSSCMNIPVDAQACDSAHQQLPPVVAMGHEFVGVRHGNRAAAAGVEEDSPYRVVAAVDGTVLEWEPALPEGAPTELDQGDVVEFWSTGPFVVRSQGDEHPFYVGQYMTGGTFVAPNGQEGDPEWVNVVPPEQYLKSYVFFTDPTYPETSLVVVRQPNLDGDFLDVSLDCAGVLDGWQPLGAYEFTRTQLVTGQFEDVGECSNGVQRMTSEGAFGVTVWGWGAAGTQPQSSSVSYAYPAGVGLRTITETKLPPIVVR